jgi:hypothetical protein
VSPDPLPTFYPQHLNLSSVAAGKKEKEEEEAEMLSVIVKIIRINSTTQVRRGC